MAFDAGIACIHQFLQLDERLPNSLVTLEAMLSMARKYDLSRNVEADQLPVFPTAGITAPRRLRIADE